MTLRNALDDRFLALRHRLAAGAVRVAASGVVLAASFVAVSAQTLERATLRLEGRSGYHAPFFMAVERGYYRDEGIDLEIFDGKGSTVTIQVVGAGSDTFGIANLSAVAVAVTKGVPLVAIGGIIQRSPDAVIALASSGITKPKDVEGRRGAFVPTGAGDRIFPAFAKVNNIDPDKIKRISISNENRYPVLLQGNADYVVGWSFTDAYKINRQKPIAPPIVFSDYGVTMLGAGLFLTKDTLAKRGKMVRGFLKASVRAIDEAIKDPLAAVAAEMKLRPDSDYDYMLEAMRNLHRFIRTPNSASLPFLATAKADWDETTTNLVTYLDAPASVKNETFYTNDYLPTP